MERHGDGGRTDIDHLEARVERLERANGRLRRLLLFTAVVTALVAPALVGWTAFGGGESGDVERGTAAFDELSVRRLVVEDAHGIPRLELTTETPDPPVYGRRLMRQSSGQAGIIFFDADGMEQGGLVTTHRGGISMGVDSKAGQQGSLWVSASGDDAGIQFYRPGDGGEHRASLVVTEEDGPSLVLERDGETVGRLPAASDTAGGSGR